MSAYESADFLLLEEGREYQKLVSSYQSTEPTVYKQNIDFTTMLSNEPFYPIESFPAFHYYNNNDQTHMQPSVYTQHQLNFQVPASPSLSSGQSTGFSISSSDHGSPYHGAEEWPFNTVEEVVYKQEYTNWANTAYQQPEFKTEGFVGKFLVH